MIKAFRIFSFILLVVLAVWMFFVLPHTLRYPSYFTYGADVISLDNFYDESKQVYLGAQLSKTRFTYEAIEDKNGILTIRNIFDVRKMTGEKIFAVERTYGVDAATGEHVKGQGDKDRSGYLFAPKDIKKQDYIYWQINYDEPALMKFQDEEVIEGLKVYRYAADYNADQTANLGFLPGVPEERGINLDINLQQWIEPVSGWMVKYEDNTTCYYYDQKTKKRLHPWNKFNNKYSTSSIVEQVNNAKKEKQRIVFRECILPLLLGAGAALLLLLSFFIRKP